MSFRNTQLRLKDLQRVKKYLNSIGINTDTITIQEAIDKIEDMLLYAVQLRTK